MTKTGIMSALITSFAALALTTGSAAARENWRYEIDKRQARHHELIAEGRHNGMLTWREGKRLSGEQIRIARMKNQFLADGDLDWNAPANFVKQVSEARTKLEKGKFTAQPVQRQFS